MKLGIGTVQFGSNYGISNNIGQTKIDEASRILKTAEKAGINMIDTAVLYGNSEEILGQILPKKHSFKIVTKTIKFNNEVLIEKDALDLENAFLQSLNKLKQQNIYGLLIHNAEDLLKNNGYLLFEKMVKLKETGMVEKIGISIYTSEQIQQILKSYEIDLIQLPINIFDQRLKKNGLLKDLKKNNIEIHARSVFLQGLLLMDYYKINEYFRKYQDHLNNYQKKVLESRFTLIQAALSYVNHIEEIDNILVGVNNNNHLLEIIDNYLNIPKDKFLNFEEFSIDDINLINPSNWIV